MSSHAHSEAAPLQGVIMRIKPAGLPYFRLVTLFRHFHGFTGSVGWVAAPSGRLELHRELSRS